MSSSPIPASAARFPDLFPADWADAWGEDEFGVWMALAYGDLSQRFRWIRPGTFLMGSPENEPERYGDEAQHQVTLSRGYWLADTACTQALWQAVMGKNPSHFQADPRQPVESVSWEDVQQFIDKLNARVPGLSARLPSEAEWEYACRAGTTTPFSFGANISPEQVNYNGEYPYAGGEKGVYRRRTVPVGSLPPNPWGLHEMHGNVWEWCQDWYGDYPREPVIDPWGPEEGADRVLRGGSWVHYGWDVRSAHRDWYEPAYRYFSLGFRLALGQGAGPAGEAGQARGTRDGQAKPLSKGEGTKMERLRDRLEPR